MGNVVFYRQSNDDWSETFEVKRWNVCVCLGVTSSRLSCRYSVRASGDRRTSLMSSHSWWHTSTHYLTQYTHVITAHSKAQSKNSHTTAALLYIIQIKSLHCSCGNRIYVKFRLWMWFIYQFIAQIIICNTSSACYCSVKIFFLCTFWALTVVSCFNSPLHIFFQS